MPALLHNMSVPPRSTLKVERSALAGRRYRIDLAGSLCLAADCTDAAITSLFRAHGSLCAMALLSPGGQGLGLTTLQERIAWLDDRPEYAVRLKAECERSLSPLRLLPGMGFFLENDTAAGASAVSGIQAIAFLASRSGSLYLPGRFELSLITVAPVTLFFPWESNHDE